MAKLVIFTQVFENYGSADTPHWKPKGGSDYVVKNVDECNLISIIGRVCIQIETDNEYFREHLLGWEVVADDYLTQFERDQLEFEGEITCPATELTV